jgi:FkbM family methyltransferase
MVRRGSRPNNLGAKVYRNPLTLYQRCLQSSLMRIRPAPLASALKRVLRVRRTVIETEDGVFWIDPISNLGVTLTRLGKYEPGMLLILEKFLRTGATFVDLGANEGYFTVIGAKRCGSRGCVVAIEPQYRLLPVITENLRLNEVKWAVVMNVAVTDTPGTVTIHLSADTNTGGSGLYRRTKYLLPIRQIEAMTLAEIFDEAQLAHVDLLKVDVEGSEYEILLGSREIFRQARVRALALELHPKILADRGKDSADITRMLLEANYRMVDVCGSAIWLSPE